MTPTITQTQPYIIHHYARGFYIIQAPNGKIAALLWDHAKAERWCREMNAGTFSLPDITK